DTVLPDAVLPDAVLPDAVLPDTVLPDAVLPDAVLPDAILPNAIRRQTVLPDAVRRCQRLLGGRDRFVGSRRGSAATRCDSQHHENKTTQPSPAERHRHDKLPSPSTRAEGCPQCGTAGAV